MNWLKKIHRSAAGASFDTEAGLYFTRCDKGDKVYVAHKRRLSLYKNGLQARIEQLLGDYRIDANLVGPGDIVFDIGANNGEVGIWAQARGARYYGFEPDPNAFAALKKNLPSQEVYDIALSDSDGKQTFFLASSDADSSLFEPGNATQSIDVTTKRLDTLLAEIELTGNIRLLKVEAEGMEPEVLEGATETLGRVEYIAVDAGPERGGENTAPQVLNLLFERGFVIVSCFLVRGTFLLKNTKNFPSD